MIRISLSKVLYHTSAEIIFLEEKTRKYHEPDFEIYEQKLSSVTYTKVYIIIQI